MKTRVVVQLDSKEGREVYLRGEGLTSLSWEKGVEMKQERSNEWVFETDEPFASGSFKVLINDQTFELGENHPLYPGASIRINPKFPEGG